MRRLALWVVLTACLPLACAGRSTGPALRNVRIALSTDAITWLPIHLARTLDTTKRKDCRWLSRMFRDSVRQWRRCSAAAWMSPEPAACW